MQYTRHRIQFPRVDAHQLGQDEAYFFVVNGDGRQSRVRFHDYDRIYSIPGLYEQLFYDRLKCNSPAKLAEILKTSVDRCNETFTELRVLDLGAGNGLMGEAMKKYGVSRLVGIDIIEEARVATERDRPHIYDAYYISNFCDLTPEEREEYKAWTFDCLTTVAALGFGDIPPRAFMEAVNMIDPHGWIAFNIKETFLGEKDASGFSRMIRDLIFTDRLSLYHLERYRHRLSMEGEPLYYYAIAGRKNGHVPEEFFDRYSD
jgi:SAM-dependent methyltransferase